MVAIEAAGKFVGERGALLAVPPSCGMETVEFLEATPPPCRTDGCVVLGGGGNVT